MVIAFQDKNVYHVTVQPFSHESTNSQSHNAVCFLSHGCLTCIQLAISLKDETEDDKGHRLIIPMFVTFVRLHCEHQAMRIRATRQCIPFGTSYANTVTNKLILEFEHPKIKW